MAVVPKIPRGVVLDLLDLYDLEIQVIDAFLEDAQHPPLKLNYRYIELTREIRSLLAKWHTEFEGKDRIKLDKFYIPFSYVGFDDKIADVDLISEVAYLDHGGQFTWGEFDPTGIMIQMHATRRLIKDLLNSKLIDEDDSKRDENIKDVIEDTKSALNEIGIKRHGVSTSTSERITKIEITALPEIRVKGTEENVIVKGKKRVHLPHFKSSDWPAITIRFITEREVVITIGKENYASTYEILGFENDKSDKPNKAWEFLYYLASRGGVSEKLPDHIPDPLKQQKKQLSDRLQTIFDNHTDPFYNVADTHVYRTRINLVPPQSVTEPSDRLGVEEYLSEVMTEE